MNMRLTVEKIVKEAEKKDCRIWDVVIEREEKLQDKSRQELWRQMADYWAIMHQSIKDGMLPGNRSLSGLVGEEGVLLARHVAKSRTIGGEQSSLAAARAMGVAVVNAGMGKIVAAPTAGSCGILPAVVLTVAEKIGADDKKIIGALFTAAGIGVVIDETASTSGAEGGCQAECGAAACMAAVAAVELAGGSPRQASHAGAIAMKNLLGLVCDPVAGLVEIPCVKRNAMGAVIALLAADMALAGIESKIPIDEVFEAMKEVSKLMPSALKETAQGGLANTPTAKEIESRLMG